MDPNLIYIKTAAGENAIQQRTRVIQRNVRMVLILVDGQSSVTDLSRKTGNPQLTENALAELEKGGYIELKVEQHDSLWEESKRVAQEIRSAAIEKAVQFSTTTDKRETYPDFKQPPAPLSLPDFKSPESDIPISLHSVFDTKSEAEFSTSQFSLAPIEPEVPKRSVQVDEAKDTITGGVGVGGHGGGTKKKAPVAKPSFMAQLKSIWASAERDLDEEPVKLNPARRAAKSSLGWPVWAFLGLVGTALICLVALLLFPYSIYLPEVEAAFSLAAGRPVRVGAMRVDVFPAPGLVLDDVRLGKGSEDEEIRIGQVYLQPHVTSLFSRRKEFRKAIIRSAELRLERMGEMPAIFSSLADQKNALGVGSIQFENADVSFSSIVLKGVDAKIELDSVGEMQTLSLRSSDKSLNFVVAPTVSGIDLTVEAFGWRPVDGSKYFFDSLNFKGKLERDVLAISGLEMRIFDGLIQGNAVVNGGGAKPNLSGSIVFDRINAAKLGDALGIGKRFIGDTAGKVRLSAGSDAWPTVFSAVNAEGEFSIQRGSVNGIDLAEAVRRVSGTPVQGGMTAFEQLSGRMKLTPDKKQFYGLAINSGLMQSTGYVDVVKDLRLAGRLELQMKGSVNQTRVPVVIGGTLDAPTVQVAGR